MSYKPNILIVGPSGSGKSTSLRNLPPGSTRILDWEKKGLPYRTTSEHQILPIDAISDFIKLRDEALKDPTVEVIVCESFTKYIEALLARCRASYKGYDIYSNYNAAIRDFLNNFKSKDKIMVMTGIDEIVELATVDGGKKNVQRLKVNGKEWEGCVEKEFLIVLFTDTYKDKDGKIHYRFVTNTDGLCSAKSPMEMFPQHIDNDLNTVIKAVKEFYKI